MSQYVNVNTVAESNGALDVFIGNGQPLVLGDAAQQLTTTPDPYDASSLNISLVGSGGSTANVTSEISGGTLGGLLAAADMGVLPQNALGLISVGLATLVNQQQESGMDLTGAQGQAMFSVGAVQTLPDASNTGSSTLAVTRTNLGALTSDDYELQYSGGAWQLSDTTTGQAVTMTGTGTSTRSVFRDRRHFHYGERHARQRRQLTHPPHGGRHGRTCGAAHEPTQIAAASLIQATAGTGNTGTAQVSAAGVTDPSTYTPGTYTIAFTSATAYRGSQAAPRP